MMINFEFFAKKIFLPAVKRLKLPKIYIEEERDKNYFLKKNENAWGYYDRDMNEIVIVRECDNWGLRIHEYGHWSINCLNEILVTLWEFLWWGLGIRSLFKKRKP